jgi:hypothetical protein
MQSLEFCILADHVGLETTACAVAHLFTVGEVIRTGQSGMKDHQS